MENQPETNHPVQKASLPGFWALFCTQFQGAFSDNVYKFLVTFLIVGMGFSTEQRDKLVPVVGALFALPFILFSMSGGFLADRYSKRRVVIGVKLAEIMVMALAMLGFALNSVPLMLVVVFLMSAQSAFFGPAKYGLLPELLPEKQLSWGNGLIGMGTYIAIISGTITAGVLSDAFGRNQVWSGALLIGLAGIGTAASIGISRLPAASPAKKYQPNPLAGLLSELKLIRGDRVLLLAVLGSTYLWFLGALFQPTIIFYGKDVLQLSDTESGYLQAALAVGIGAGSLTAGFLSGKKIEYGLVPLGGVGLTLFSAPLNQTGLSFTAVAAILGLLGFSAGFYIVPINALIQHRPEAGNKGGVIAASAMLSFIGIFLASGVYYLLVPVLGLKPPQVFLVTAVMSLAGMIYMVWLLPDALVRLLLWLVTHTIYRIRVQGRDNIPEKGGALFVCNHVSWMDAALLMASTDRSVRFLMFKGIYDNRWLKPLYRILGVIPISSEQRPRELIQSLQAASNAIRSGEVVCIFAEGQITRIGQLLPFRRGLERIMKDVDAPIVPVALDGVWGSIFSFEKRRFLWKLPQHIPFPVTVGFGKPLAATASAFTVRQAVEDLLATAWTRRRERMRPLPRQFISAARRHPRRFAMADAQTKGITFGTALVRAVFLARRLRRVWAGQEMVGLLLPPSVPGALVNWAALLCGKVPVNLNYTLSAEGLAACVKQCGIRNIITSRVFLEKAKLSVPGEALYLEDLAKMPSLSEKISGWLLARFSPAGLLMRVLLADHQPKKADQNPLDALATVIFSSGSTGDPKGVMLSHYNIGSNIQQMEQVFGLGKHDRVLGVLPFFHSFGFTGTFCLPGVLGVGVVFHANPLDTKTIGPLVREHAVSFLLATPTFLQLYLRGCAPGDFGSVQLVMTGAEKLPERLAQAFEERFGIRPLEGYGCTECGPAVAVNTFDFRGPGFRQVGAKRGKIGHPLPGVSVRIVDPENPTDGKDLPLGESGMLLVRGPNVMRGYLGQPAKTAEVLHDGWYVTGDIAALDEDGFLQITGRLSRFSKIGGEMVPHLRVEEKLHELAGAAEQTFVVAGVPDEKKGERLVVFVLQSLSENELAAVIKKFNACELPNLWKPKAEAFHRVAAFPLLGTGKLDLRAVKDMVAKLSESSISARGETPR